MKILSKAILVGISCLAINSYAGTTSTPLVLNGSVSSSCSGGFSAGTLTFSFVPGSQSSSQNTTYTLTCTAGAVISSFGASSANGWDFKGATSNDLINYSISSITSSPYAAEVATVWSGSSGTTTPTDLLTGGSITINGAAAPIVSTLTITPVTTPLASNVDSYSDTVTIANSY